MVYCMVQNQGTSDETGEEGDEMDKQTTIDLLDNLLGMVEDNHESDYDTAIHMGIDAIKALPSEQPEVIRCKDCRWGREVCGNIECFVDSNIPPEYHGYEWFCPNGERRTDE